MEKNEKKSAMKSTCSGDANNSSMAIRKSFNNDLSDGQSRCPCVDIVISFRIENWTDFGPWGWKNSANFAIAQISDPDFHMLMVVHKPMAKAYALLLQIHLPAIFLFQFFRVSSWLVGLPNSKFPTSREDPTNQVQRKGPWVVPQNRTY